MSILERINGHDDLVQLDHNGQNRLCDEIREFLVSRVSKTGGHLASNLGVVELTVAIETVFNTNIDRLVFDVGHQCYVHKLLTGRQADFDELRQYGGIAGFPKPAESATDAFVAGHASSSVSIALGMARARTLLGQNHDIVALIGDGATTGGMAYEGLNDAADSDEPMVIVFNDNEMSIDRNVGGVARRLSMLRTKGSYLGMKLGYRKLLMKLPGGVRFYRFSQRVKNRLKRFLLPTTIFESMGLSYIGPVDGHDLPELVRVLQVAKQMRRPVVVHVLTQKGRGYSYAEEKPSKFHGVGKFDPISGTVKKSGGQTFSDAFGTEMIRLAQEDARVCAITAAMPGGTGLLEFREKFPKRLFDVGIAEEHAVSMAGGLAKQGMIPVVALYSTFLQRGFDQLLQDVAILKNHVVFAVDRAGLVGEDGETHHGVFDVGYLRQIPGLTVLCPASCDELSRMLRWAVLEQDGPVAIRYPRGGDGSCKAYENSGNSCNSVCCHRAGSDVALICYGTVLETAMQTAELLSQHGVEASVIRLRSVQPLPVRELCAQLGDCTDVFVIEETMSGSGISQAVCAALNSDGRHCKVTGFDLGEKFVTHGSIPALYAHCGLDAKSVAKKILEVHQIEN